MSPASSSAPAPHRLPTALRAVAADPILQLLLESRIPARLAWTASDGSPRIAPMWFTWTGEHFVVSAFAGARKLANLTPATQVALSIDTEDFPYRSLAVRGVVTEVRTVDGLTPDYESAAARYLSSQLSEAWCDALRPGTNQVRISIRPTAAVVSDLARGQFFSRRAT